MKSCERDFLSKEKQINDKSSEQAWKEIRELEKSEKQFKKLWHEKNYLEKEVNKLEKEISILKDKNFKLKFELDKNKSIKKIEPSNIKEVYGSLAHFKRLINYMEKGKSYSKTDLCKELIIPTKEVEEWMKIIMEYKIMDIKFDGCHYTRL